MSLLGEWRLTRERRRQAANYLQVVAQDADHADVQWLASVIPSHDEGAALRELRFARRALGLIVAERDALDDRTASDVAHQLSVLIAHESRRDPDAARMWSERWRAYTGALAARGSSESPTTRMARVLLAEAGAAEPSPDELKRATEYIVAVRSSSNEALRTAFGSASLPDDIRPSALRTVAR